MFYSAAFDHQTKREVVKLLTTHGITPTQQRIVIGQVMLTKPQHMSADQILEKVNAQANNVSKATVYNTLGLFTAKGLLREVIVDSTKVFYDSNTLPHHHFYNVDTGTLHDIDANLLAISELPEPPDSARIKDINVIVRVSKAG